MSCPRMLQVAAKIKHMIFGSQDDTSTTEQLPDYHGDGSMMLCFLSAGPGKLVKGKGQIKVENYREILEDNMFPSARELWLLRSFTFQEENDPKHLEKAKNKWFEDSKVDVLGWPSQRPNVNTIEFLWQSLKWAVHSQSQ